MCYSVGIRRNYLGFLGCVEFSHQNTRTIFFLNVEYAKFHLFPSNSWYLLERIVGKFSLHDLNFYEIIHCSSEFSSKFKTKNFVSTSKMLGKFSTGATLLDSSWKTAIWLIYNFTFIVLWRYSEAFMAKSWLLPCYKDAYFAYNVISSIYWNSLNTMIYAMFSLIWKFPYIKEFFTFPYNF